MFNRTLQRPMFRIGGSAGTGITTGLTRPRQGYNQGLSVKPENFPGSQEEWEAQQKILIEKGIIDSKGKRDHARVRDYETGEHWTDTSNVGEKLSSIENNVTNNMVTGNKGMPPSDYEMMKAELGDMPTPSKYPYKASDFFMGLGANILAQPGGQSIFQTIGKAARGPIDQLSKTQQSDWGLGEKGKLEQWKSDKDLLLAAYKNTSQDEKNKLWTEANNMFERGGVNPYTNQPFKTPQEAYNLLLKQKFMSKEKVFTPEAQYNESYDLFRKKHLGNMNFKGNSVAASNLAKHEANIVHNKYPEEVKEQFNLTQLWIDPTFFDTETMQLNEIGDIIPGIEVGKIYMNVSDGKIYKLGPNKIFEVVSLTDLQG